MKHSTQECANAQLFEEIANLRNDVTLLLTGQGKPENPLGLVDKLQKDNAEKDVNTATLEKRIDELEQYSPMDNVFGLRVNHTSYSLPVAQSNSDETNVCCPVTETNSCEEQVLSFLRSKTVEISKNDISIYHTVKTKTNKPLIVMKFNNRRAKNRV